MICPSPQQLHICFNFAISKSEKKTKTNRQEERTGKDQYARAAMVLDVSALETTWLVNTQCFKFQAKKKNPNKASKTVMVPTHQFSCRFLWFVASGVSSVGKQKDKRQKKKGNALFFLHHFWTEPQRLSLYVRATGTPAGQRPLDDTVVGSACKPFGLCGFVSAQK